MLGTTTYALKGCFSHSHSSFHRATVYIVLERKLPQLAIVDLARVKNVLHA